MIQAAAIRHFFEGIRIIRDQRLSADLIGYRLHPVLQRFRIFSLQLINAQYPAAQRIDHDAYRYPLSLALHTGNIGTQSFRLIAFQKFRALHARDRLGCRLHGPINTTFAQVDPQGYQHQFHRSVT